MRTFFDVVDSINAAKSERELLLALIAALMDDDLNRIDGLFYSGHGREIGSLALTHLNANPLFELESFQTMRKQAERYEWVRENGHEAIHGVAEWTYWEDLDTLADACIARRSQMPPNADVTGKPHDGA